MSQSDETKSQPLNSKMLNNARQAARLISTLAENFAIAGVSKQDVEYVDMTIEIMDRGQYHAMIAYCLQTVSQMILDQMAQATESN